MSEQHNGGPALLMLEKGVWVFASRLAPLDQGDKRKMRLWVALTMPCGSRVLSLSRGPSGRQHWCVVDDFGNLVTVPE